MTFESDLGRIEIEAVYQLFECRIFKAFPVDQLKNIVFVTVGVGVVLILV